MAMYGRKKKEKLCPPLPGPCKPKSEREPVVVETKKKPDKIPVTISYPVRRPCPPRIAIKGAGCTETEIVKKKSSPTGLWEPPVVIWQAPESTGSLQEETEK